MIIKYGTKKLIMKVILQKEILVTTKYKILNKLYFHSTIDNKDSGYDKSHPLVELCT